MYDHRKLGRELEIFDTDPLIGAGLPYWQPAGAAIRHALEEYVRELERRAGYQHVYSPVLAKRELYEHLRALGALPRWHVPADGRSAASRWCCGRACVRTTR